MLKNKNIYFISFSIILASFMFYNQSLDPDMFWHIKNGENILLNGISDVNYQSYSSGQFISHSWLYDVILFYIFNLFGYTGVKVFSNVFIGATIFFVLKFASKKSTNLGILSIVVFAYFVVISQFLEVRPHQVSLFLTVLAIYIIEEKRANPIYLFFLGVIFANLHGAAILQLFIIVILHLFSGIIEGISHHTFDKKQIKYLILSLLGIAVGSLVNPYGKEILLYATNALSEDFVSASIMEWKPLIEASKEGFSVFSLFLLLCSLAGIAYSKKGTIKEIIFASYAIMSAILYRRLYLLAVILILIYSYEHIEIAIKGILGRVLVSNKKLEKMLASRSFTYTILTLSVVFFISGVLDVDFEEKIKNSIITPDSILSYIEDNRIKTENEVVFNHFNFGGYMLFRGHKTFIDGRSDPFLETYKDNEPIFRHYLIITKERIPEKTREWIKKYNIKYFIIYSKGYIENSQHEYLEYFNIAKTLFDDGKYALLEVIE